MLIDACLRVVQSLAYRRRVFSASHAIVAISDIGEHFGDFMIGRSAPEKGALATIEPEIETRFPNRQHSLTFNDMRMIVLWELCLRYHRDVQEKKGGTSGIEQVFISARVFDLG